MGLDQRSYYKDKDGDQVEIQWWRKHNALHGWMESLWRRKTDNDDESFNCIPVELTSDDLAELQDAVTNNELPETFGFFFGNDSRKDKEQKEATLEFIKEANKALASGSKVYYDSWW